MSTRHVRVVMEMRDAVLAMIDGIAKEPGVDPQFIGLARTNFKLFCDWMARATEHVPDDNTKVGDA